MVDEMTFDFVALADGVVRNNVGVGGMEVEVRASIEAGRVVIEGTGQRFAADGDPADAPAAWRRFRVSGWDDAAKTRLRLLGP